MNAAREVAAILGMLLLVAVLVWLLLVGAASIAIGFHGDPSCGEPFKRVEYVVPSRVIGCWLHEEVKR